MSVLCTFSLCQVLEKGSVYEKEHSFSRIDANDDDDDDDSDNNGDLL